MIVKTIKDKKVVTELKTLQSAAINGEVSISDIVVADPQLALNDEQAQELTATLKEDLSITYKIDAPDTEEQKQEEKKEEIAPEEPKSQDTTKKDEVQVAVVDTGVAAPAQDQPTSKPKPQAAVQAPSQRVL